MKRPQPDEFGLFYEKYIASVDDDVIAELEKQLTEFPDFLKMLPAKCHDFSYAPGKWTLKELLGHVIDTERIMAYRMLCFARNDSNALPGFEENEYVENAHFANMDFGIMADEFAAVRKSNMFLFKALNDEELDRSGLANGGLISVRALLFIIAGHLNHHKRIINERYL